MEEIFLNRFKNKDVNVVGLGVTGIAAVKFFLKCKANITAFEEKDITNNIEIENLKNKGVTVVTDPFRKSSFKKDSLTVISPGVPFFNTFFEELKNEGLEIISDIELCSYIENSSEKIIAVTGTNGKSTVTELIGEVLKNAGKRVFVGGNLGTPVTSVLEKWQDYDYFVLELSSYQLENIKNFKPHVAILLNVTEDHLDRYESFKQYGDTKLNIFMNQNVKDYSVINFNDSFIGTALNEGKINGKIVPFRSKGPLKEGLFFNGSDIEFIFNGFDETYSLKDVKLKGIHNVENIMAVIGALRSIKIEKDIIEKTIENFSTLPHRMEEVATIKGINFINDSKGTNVGALQKALEGDIENIILIAGGVDKGGDYSPLKPLVHDKVSVAILIGQAKEKIEAVIKDDTKVAFADTLKEAVDLAFKNAQKGDTVLFCPACSSFDMFKDYKDRGNAFKKEVIKIKEND